MNQKLMGIDLGGTTTKFAIVNLEGQIQQQWSIETDILNDGRQIVPNIVDSINHHLDLYQMAPDDFVGIGMGSPGTINRNQGTVKGAFNLNWNNTQAVKTQIEARTGIRVILENDANVAALGEKWQGAGNNCADMVFVTLGTGVGGGIINQNCLVLGYDGSAGEIGHINVSDDGFQCTCGRRGCLETVASATGIVRLAQSLSEQFSGESALKKMTDSGAEITAELVFNSAKTGDRFAVIVVEQVSDYLGKALSMIANTLNPQYIVIGGGVSNAGQFLIDALQPKFDDHLFPGASATQLRLATLGNRAGVLGAAFLAKTTFSK